MIVCCMYSPVNRIVFDVKPSNDHRIRENKYKNNSSELFSFVFLVCLFSYLIEKIKEFSSFYFR